MAAWVLWTPTVPLPPLGAAALLAAPLWGFLQAALGATVERGVTLDWAVQWTALAATAWTVSASLNAARLIRLLEFMTWFGCLLSLASVLAYYTSPGRVFWIFPAPYPDVWGPFLSRNNFAQFLEITLPAALWLALHERPEHAWNWVYGSCAAVMLAAGLASASRAGALVLGLETAAALALSGAGKRRLLARIALGAVLLAGAFGAETLLRRFTLELMQDRAQICRATVAMIAERPWTGHGLGTFAWVYPRFAVFDSGYRIDRAHSDWLEWAAGGGAGFLAVWAALALSSAWRARHDPWAWGIPAVLLHALVDFPLARTGIAAWLFLLLGALAWATRHSRPRAFVS